MAKRLDVTGKRYGKLPAEYMAGVDKHNRSVWFCRCDCGGTKEVEIGVLQRGDTRSCG